MCNSYKYIHSLLLVPLFRGVTAYIAVEEWHFMQGTVVWQCFVSLAIAVSNKYYVLNTWCVNPCGELPITSRHLPSLRGEHDLGRGGTFCVDCPQCAWLSARALIRVDG